METGSRRAERTCSLFPVLLASALRWWSLLLTSGTGDSLPMAEEVVLSLSGEAVWSKPLAATAAVYLLAAFALLAALTELRFAFPLSACIALERLVASNALVCLVPLPLIQRWQLQSKSDVISRDSSNTHPVPHQL